MEQDIAAQVVGLGGATDFSLWKLFLRADWVVKSVIILLIACSIFSWALIFDKIRLFKNINNSIEDFEKKFWKAKSAESFNNSLPVKSDDPAILIFKSAMAELIKTKRQSSAIQSARLVFLEIAIDWKEFIIPQTVPNKPIKGAVDPTVARKVKFFSTFFISVSIAISRNTSLAIVAPGIAEALFATALGLLAAIPAVVAYNKFNSDTQRYFSKIENFSKRFLSII